MCVCVCVCVRARTSPLPSSQIKQKEWLYRVPESAPDIAYNCVHQPLATSVVPAAVLKMHQAYSGHVPKSCTTSAYCTGATGSSHSCSRGMSRLSFWGGGLYIQLQKNFIIVHNKCMILKFALWVSRIQPQKKKKGK